MSSRFSLSHLNQKQWLALYLLAALLIAWKVMLNQHGWVNNDSLLYFEQARLIAAGEFKQAFTMFSWVFYPSLIALIHRLTHLDIQTSAQCLNAVCFIVFVAGFQQLLLAAGAKARTLHWGHWLLFSTPYMVGDVLGMLLRDEGFWAAFTWGLVYWLRTLKTLRWQDALCFQGCMAIAVLFRIESSAYLLALPLFMLFYQTLAWPQRLKLWLQSNVLALSSAAILGAAVATGALQVEQLGRLQEIFTQLLRLFSERIDFIQLKADIISKQVLGEDLDQFGSFSLWSTLILITALKTLRIAGLPALVAILWRGQTWWSKFPASTRHLAVSTLSISVIVSLVIIFNVFVLSSRYVIASGIVMLMLAAFAMSEWQKKWPKWGIYLYTSLLGLMLMNSLWDRGYLDLDRLAVNYVQQTHAQHQPVFYDTENARFYAGQPYMNRLLGRTVFPSLVDKGEIDQYAVYMITISKDDADVAYEKLAAETLKQHHFTLVHTIYGWHRKSKALIFVRQEPPA